MPGADLLARTDAILVLAAVLELRAMVAGAEGFLCRTENLPDDADDLLDTTSAAARFGHPRDTIAKWCREGDGRKVGGRWLVSIPRLQKRLNGK